MDKNDDVDALTGIISLLKKVSQPEQERILQAVATFLDIPVRHGFPSKEEKWEPSPRHHGSQPIAGGFSEDRSISPKEFLKQKMPRTDVERVACLGYYLAHYRNTPHFKTLDISTLNTEAAYPKFSNAAMAVDNANKTGLLVQAVKGNKQMSAAGETYVQTLPDREAAQAGLKAARVPRRPKKTVARVKG